MGNLFAKPQSSKKRKLDEESFKSIQDEEVALQSIDKEECETFDCSVGRTERLEIQLDMSRKKKRGKKKRKKALGPPDDFNPQLVKFWYQRYLLFSRFDEGIHMDDEAWYSVTPEAIAIKIADRCRTDLIFDPFCGVGGNTIQFAARCHRVLAMDIDPRKLAMARHNAEIYGLADRIEFILCDFMDLDETRFKPDLIFLSPPWGGPEYTQKSTFSIEEMGDLCGLSIFDKAQRMTPNIAYYLPKNTDFSVLHDCTIEDCIGETGALKAKIAYFGELREEAEEAEEVEEVEEIDLFAI